MIQKLLNKLTILFLILSIPLIGYTNASFIDVESSNGNIFQAGSVDFTLQDTDEYTLTSPFFNIIGMVPLDSENKTVIVKNIGSLDFTYYIKAVKTDGDDNLCNNLNIEAKLDGTTQYNGSLTGLNLNPAATSTGSSDDWEFILSLNNDDSTLQGKMCEFNLEFKGWQTDNDGTWGFYDVETLSNHVDTGCWVAPSVPVLVSPANNTYAGLTSVWNLNPVMDWSDSTNSCPLSPTNIQYQYEAYRNSSLTTLAYRSGWLSNSQIPAPGTPEGKYYWRVQARNQNGQESGFSNVWLLVVDRTAPPVPDLVSPGNNTSLNSSGLLQTWEQVADNLGGEVYYEYESYNDEGLSSIRWSGTYNNSNDGDGLVITKNASGAQNGDVYWRVRSRDMANNRSGWSEVWYFLIDNNLPNPTVDGDTSTAFDIVLNEILPDPIGDDDDPKPDGEWIELYNKSGSEISVSGWRLTDSDGNEVEITGSITNTGDTKVSGEGFLVVYVGPSSLTLDDDGDTVNLYSGTVIPANLVDLHEYDSTPEGKSIVRYPDGDDTWYDPMPTPGEPNTLEEESSEDEEAKEDEQPGENVVEENSEPEDVEQNPVESVELEETATIEEEIKEEEDGTAENPTQNLVEEQAGE